MSLNVCISDRKIQSFAFNYPFATKCWVHVNPFKDNEM